MVNFKQTIVFVDNKTNIKYHQTYPLTLFFFKMSLWKNTHEVSVIAGYQDVHLWALGADDLTAQRVFAQVDMATVRLVDGDSGHLTHDLHTKKATKWTMKTTVAVGFISDVSETRFCTQPKISLCGDLI